MGQRHQLFVRIANPIKYLPNKSEIIEEVGDGDYTILAFHDNWLYGRSVLSRALNLLEFAAQIPTEEKTQTNDKYVYGNDTVPFTIANHRGRRTTFKGIVNNIQLIYNFVHKTTPWHSIGFKDATYLNESEPIIREDFSIGDNNDGVTILDLVDNKYCFINIDEQDLTKSDVRRLPKFKPSTAKEYVKAYYGETISSVKNDYCMENKTKEELKAYVEDNIRINAEASAGFEQFELLTTDELKKMFPKMKFETLDLCELVEKKKVK